jgi:hypothetical protein
LVFIHIEHICTFFVTFFSATIDGRNLIFCHKLHIGTPYRGKRFWTHRIPISCLPTLLIFIHIEHTCSFFVAFFSATIDGRNLIFGHKLHIGTPYRGKGFWTHQIPASCLPICWFLYTFNIHLYIHIFRRIFLSNYWWQKSDIWSQASYRYPILCETFFDPSDSYFLFAEERGYHRWALAHSSSCFFCWKFFWKQKKILFHLLTSGIYYLQFKNR